MLLLPTKTRNMKIGETEKNNMNDTTRRGLIESDIIGIIERKYFELHVESPHDTMKIALICSKLIRIE